MQSQSGVEIKMDTIDRFKRSNKDRNVYPIISKMIFIHI